MMKVGLEGGAKNKDVVEVDHDTDFEEVARDVVHGGLEYGGGVSETEKHYEKLVVPEAGAEGGLVGVLLADVDLVEAAAEVDLGEVFGSTQAMKKFGYPGKRILVLDRDPVQSAVVCAHAEFRGAVLLDEETAGSEGGGARLNESFFKEFIEPALHFFGLRDGEPLAATETTVVGLEEGAFGGGELFATRGSGGGGRLGGQALPFHPHEMDSLEVFLAEVRKAIMVEKAGKEIGERELGLMGEGCGEVGEAYPLDAGDEDVVRNDSRRDVEAEGANVLDESLGILNLREEKEDTLVGEAGERRDIGGAEGAGYVPVAGDNASEGVEVAVVGRGRSSDDDGDLGSNEDRGNGEGHGSGKITAATKVSATTKIAVASKVTAAMGERTAPIPV
ncbi:hypothetical protein CBR_g29900 [Chara braunii]|uniref:Uncharacterized protein n=1 Tax=Chara braunii TaxID=69332 RepID=A0A388JX30_CHABU|nr:hypothetical protein CBR_g29900 [Chara braunii]|eukprot:GBG62292.1 hypothetical protein CBR_g29900 [Chara braunii]